MTMEINTERLGEEREMLGKECPNFALDTQSRECTGQIFSNVPNQIYEVSIRLSDTYPETAPHIIINFPQGPVIDYFVNKNFHQSSLRTVAQWSPQEYLKDVVSELEDYIRQKKEKAIATLLSEKDILNEKKPNFGFTKDFKKIKGSIFSRKVMSAMYDIEVSISSQFPEKPPKINVFSPNDPLLTCWVDITINDSDIPTLAHWTPNSSISDLLEELENAVYSREKKAERILEERDILRKQNPAFGFTPEGDTCKGKIYSVLGQNVYQVTIALPHTFPANPPNVVITPPGDPLIKACVNMQIIPTELGTVSPWNPQTHIADIVKELHQLVRSREEILLKRLIDEQTSVRKKWPNFGFTPDMKECNGVVYTSSESTYQVIIDLRGFPRSIPKVRVQGPALANKKLDLPVLKDWNPSVAIDAIIESIQKEICQLDTRHTSINAELGSLRTFWRSLDFLPGNPRTARGSATVSLPSGDCNVTLAIEFPPNYPESPPIINLNATGFKSNEIKSIEASLKRKMSSSWMQCKKTSEILKRLPEDLIVCLIGRDEITRVDFKEEVRRKQPIYYCKQCMDKPSRKICYFHKSSLDTIMQRGRRCIRYPTQFISEEDVGILQP